MPSRKLSKQPFVGTHFVSRIAICACGLFLAFTLYAQDVSTPGTPPQGPGAGRGAPAANLNKFIVTFSPTTTVEDRVAAATAVGATIGHNLYRWNQLAITVPNLNAVAALTNNLLVLSIVPDRPLSTGAKGGVPDPPGGGNGGGGDEGGGGGGPTYGGTQQLVTAEVQRVGPPSDTSDGTGIGIALLDTGADFGHADLPLAPDDPGVTSFNAFNPTGLAQDVWGHGTGVAGLIAALNNNIDIGECTSLPATPYLVVG